MRRWDGWGFEDVDAHLGARGRAFVEAQVGTGAPPAFATLADVVGSVPASRVAAHDLLDTEPEARVRHARGQSLPDLLDLRFGRLERGPRRRRPARAPLRGPRDPRPRPIDGRRGSSRTAAARASSAASTPGRRADPLVTVDLARLAGVTSIDERAAS